MRPAEGRNEFCPSTLPHHRKRLRAIMIDRTPSDDGISAMVDIARLSGQNLNPEQRRQLDRLIADGLIENKAGAAQGEAAKYAVTPKGQKMLDDRGVGVNES
jgi:predicted transcriptional regulator